MPKFLRRAVAWVVASTLRTRATSKQEASALPEPCDSAGDGSLQGTPASNELRDDQDFDEVTVLDGLTHLPRR